MKLNWGFDNISAEIYEKPYSDDNNLFQFDWCILQMI